MVPELNLPRSTHLPDSNTMLAKIDDMGKRPESINRFIKQISNRELTGEEIAQIWQETTDPNKAGYEELRETEPYFHYILSSIISNSEIRIQAIKARANHFPQI